MRVKFEKYDRVKVNTLLWKINITLLIFILIAAIVEKFMR